MKRHESGYGMKIIMESTATEEQIEIARKMYPNALILIKENQNKDTYDLEEKQ